jgi:hypothetical protein
MRNRHMSKSLPRKNGNTAKMWSTPTTYTDTSTELPSANDYHIDDNNLAILTYLNERIMGSDSKIALEKAMNSIRQDSNNRQILGYISTQLKEVKDKKKLEETLLPVLTKRFNETKTKNPTSTLTELLSFIITDLGNNLGYNTRPSNSITPSPLAVMQHTAPEYKPGQTWTNDIDNLLKRKNLKSNLFASSHEIKWSDDIADHVTWAFNNIYSVRYPHTHEEWHKINRYFHGIQHVTRAALHVPVFINLYRKHGDADALKLTDDDVKLLQLAAVFHDSAREGEGVDKWDHESGMFLYTYLTQTLRVPKDKAKLISEAIANKDISEDGYFEIIENKKEELSWQWNKTKKDLAKNIYQKIVHDADCLEVIRARDVYNASYLDFYKDIAINNKEALEEMAHLVTEARSLIYKQGDTQGRTRAWIKQKYEHQDAYHSIKDDISPQRHPIMYALNNLLSPKELKKQLVDTSTYDEAKGLTEDNLRAALREGKVYARGISIVSARSTKHSDESLVGLELRKTMREINVPTKTKKGDSLKKQGNPYRSVSMIGYGSGVFTNSGFLIVNPDINAISSVSATDSDSGFGKKAHLKNQAKPSQTEIKNKLTAVHNKLKLGGEVRTFQSGKKAAYVEILYDIKNYQGIFYTNDATFSNELHYGSPYPVHTHAPLLQAIYLQKQYEIEFEKSKESYGKHIGKAAHQARFGTNKTLPIFLYSGSHNEIKKVSDEELTEENIIKMWTEMCSDYLNNEIKNPHGHTVSSMTPQQIKTCAMYKKLSSQFINTTAYHPADELYAPELQKKITLAIEKIVDGLFKIPPNLDLNALDSQEQKLLLQEMRRYPKIVEAFNKTTPTPTTINGILLLAQFHAEQIEEAQKRHANKPAYIENIEKFYTKGIDIILSKKADIEKNRDLRKLAKQTFSPKYMGLKILADALMVISVIFLAVGIYRAKTGSSFFLSNAKSPKQKKFIELADKKLPLPNKVAGK